MYPSTAATALGLPLACAHLAVSPLKRLFLASREGHLVAFDLAVVEPEIAWESSAKVRLEGAAFLAHTRLESRRGRLWALLPIARVLKKRI